MIRWMGFVAILVSSSAFAAPGDLQSYRQLPSLTPQQINRIIGDDCNNWPPGVQNKLGKANIKYYAVIYETTGLDGQPVTASGAFAVPDNGSGPFDVVSFQHGTTFGRDAVPSRANEEGLAGVACYGSQNNVVVAADYLGYGDSKGNHPYLHVKTESTAAVDMLRAGRQLAAKLKLKLSDKLFLAGYSQGGAATMALHKYIQENLSGEFTVTASAPMAGPYNLETTVLEVAKNPSQHSSIEFGYILWALNPIYHFISSLDVAVQAPYANQLDRDFDGTHDWTFLMESLPADLNKFVVAKFMSELASNPNHPLRKALRENNVDDWKPKAPMLLIQGKVDIEVPTSNTINTCKHMKALGAPVDCKLLDGMDHGYGFISALPVSIDFFNSLR